jgi:hypothetical protein
MASRLWWAGYADRIEIKGRHHQGLITYERDKPRWHIARLDRVLEDDVNRPAL